PDLVVVGFQELIPQGMGARLPLGGSCHGAADSGVKRDAGRLEFLDPWIDFVVRDLEAAYGGGEDGARTYEPYYVSRMIALGIIVFVRRGDGEKVRIRALWEGDIGTGLLGKYPNKGCVAVGLDIEIVDHHHHHLLPRRRTSLCFANSHLGPHEGHAYYEWRNEEVRHIFDSLLLQPQTEPVHPADEDDKSPNEIVRALDDFNAVFYFGDLNYRLMGAGVKDPAARREYRATVMRHIDAGSVEPLLAMDELCNIREFLHFRALAGWLEPPISFLPSYKYKIEDLELPADHDAGLVLRAEDRFSKTRMPAYCDRIMY
ncbi:Endonuclease/exonuclease/phosphatase, partial [Powellomyces hirtus]